MDTDIYSPFLINDNYINSYNDDSQITLILSNFSKIFLLRWKTNFFRFFYYKNHMFTDRSFFHEV